MLQQSPIFTITLTTSGNRSPHTHVRRNVHSLHYSTPHFHPTLLLPFYQRYQKLALQLPPYLRYLCSWFSSFSSHRFIPSHSAGLTLPTLNCPSPHHALFTLASLTTTPPSLHPSHLRHTYQTLHSNVGYNLHTTGSTTHV